MRYIVAGIVFAVIVTANVLKDRGAKLIDDTRATLQAERACVLDMTVSGVERSAYTVNNGVCTLK